MHEDVQPGGDMSAVGRSPNNQADGPWWRQTRRQTAHLKISCGLEVPYRNSKAASLFESGDEWQFFSARGKHGDG